MMNTRKRAWIYLKRCKNRTILLILTLTIITSCMMIGLSLSIAADKSIKDLQKQYGSNFKIESIRDNDVSNTMLWEQTNNEDSPYPQHRYKGPLVDDELIENVMGVSGITSFCKETEVSLIYFRELNLIQGSWYRDYINEMQSGEAFDPDYVVQPIVIYKTNVLKACNDSRLVNYFHNSAFELIEGRHIQQGDKGTILISDVLAEQNQLSLGDTIRADQLSLEYIGNEIKNENDIPIVSTEYLKIIGIFHVNTEQYINEDTTEDMIAENFMFVDINVATEMYRTFNAVYGEPIDPFYTVSFFVDDPDEMEEIIDKVWKLDGIDKGNFDIQIDHSSYQSALEPLQTMKRLSLIMVAFCFVICILLVVLLLRLWLHSRNREVGILLSVGITPGSIVRQFIIEGCIVACISLCLAGGITALSASALGNGWLHTMSAQNNVQEEPKELSPNAGGEEIAAYTKEFEVKTDVQVPENIKIEFSLLATGLCVIIILSVIVLSVLLISNKTVHRNPKDYLL